jgi:hypothetical protein
MKFVSAFKNFVSPSATAELAKLDAHLLADMGFNTANARTNTIRIPAEAGVRLV